MTNTEAIIRTILGPIRRDTRPLACSVDCLSELLFVQKIPMDEIMVTKEMLFYLSVYSHWNVPFFTAVQAQPSLLF